MKRSTMPSLAALLGLLAVAGYQNRDKLSEWLKTASAKAGDAQAAAGAGAGGLLGGVMKNVTDMMGGAGLPADIPGGLKNIVDSFRNAGHGEAADSWVATGPNQPVTPAQTESALGNDLIDMLVKQTGLDRADILKRLAEVLPQAVDKMSPEGHLTSS